MSHATDAGPRVSCTRIASRALPVTVEVARFSGTSGVEELHVVAQPSAYERFNVQLDWLARAVEEALGELGIGPGSTIWRRLLCSDLPNQAPLLAAAPISNPVARDDPCAVSWIGQAPSGPAKVALWSYHMADAQPLDKTRFDNTLVLARGDLRHHWTTGLAAPREAGCAAQTTAIFEAYQQYLHAQGMSLADNVLRTWLFLRDIDVDYTAMSDARRELFAHHGLTPETHYIASTGIAGQGPVPDIAVTLDAYALAGVRPEQIAYIRSLAHLSSTDLYGVTFERATAIDYRDRRHVLVSGTASIDARGRLLHTGDVGRQIDRTFENIAALLTQAGATLSDLGVLIAYIRDPSDADRVRADIRRRCGDVPLLVVTGAVCRPGWLVEIEGQALVPATSAHLPHF